MLAERLSYMEAWARTRAAEEVYLRFGDLPEGGHSWNVREECYEAGTSVYSARKVEGGYVLDVRRDPRYGELIGTLVKLMLEGRPLYVATGNDAGEGIDGEVLLEDASLTPVSPMVRLLPPLSWRGSAVKRFFDGWNRWRRNGGFRNESGWTRASLDSWSLLDEASRAHLELECALNPGGRAAQFSSEVLEEIQRHLRSFRQSKFR